MPKHVLTDRAIKSLKPAAKRYKKSDGNGLNVHVFTDGTKKFIQKFYLGGSERGYTIGEYPGITLARARQESDRIRALVKLGQDPVAERKAKAAGIVDARTFKQLILAWHADQTTGMTDKHAKQILDTLERHLFPALGSLPESQVTAPIALKPLKRVEAAGSLETAHRCRMWASKAYRWAIASGDLTQDPFELLKGALKTRSSKKNFKSIPADEMPKFLKALNKYPGEPLTLLALRLTIRTMVRTNETRFARWCEFDLDNKLWQIPGERMKMSRPHEVPLSDQVIKDLQRLHTLSGRGPKVIAQWDEPEFAGSPWLFPQVGTPSKPMSENTMLYALYRLGYHSRATVHGFRALASTVLNESGEFDPDVIERQLAHVEGNNVRAAYNHAKYMPERFRMAQWWADWLDERLEATP